MIDNTYVSRFLREACEARPMDPDEEADLRSRVNEALRARLDELKWRLAEEAGIVDVVASRRRHGDAVAAVENSLSRYRQEQISMAFDEVFG